MIGARSVAAGARTRVGPGHAGTPGRAERVQLAATVGAVLRTARAAAGLSQPALARRSGVSERHIGRLESGRRRPRASTLAAVAAVLDPRDVRRLADDLVTAAGSSLRADTPAGRRQRDRRTRGAAAALRRAAEARTRRSEASLRGALAVRNAVEAFVRADAAHQRGGCSADEVSRAASACHRALDHWTAGGDPVTHSSP